MKLEAVSCCFGYSDFLAETAKYNVGVLDRWIICTSKDDLATREVCRKYSLECLLTNDHKHDGKDFNKGRVVERALQHLSSNGWRLHLDSDIVLPNKMKHILKSAQLNENKIYGADRIMVRSFEDWEKFQKLGWLTHDYHCRVAPASGFEIGTRWCSANFGYTPIGFFQLWNGKSDQFRGSRIKPYPSDHNDACRTDVQFALHWDRSERELLPEMFVVHLESERCPNGTNWKGRKSAWFSKDGNFPKLNDNTGCAS